jgi:DNA-binding NtrC family response regulator
MAVKVAERERPDLVLLDVVMPGVDGFETCRRLKSAAATARTPVVFITGHDDARGIVEGFRAGGVDYVVKPFRREELLARIRTHLEHAYLVRALEAELARGRALDGRLSMISRRESEHWGLDAFVGQSATIRAILERIGRLRNADAVSVLITGESGTGKELVARAIHAGSARAREPFVAVNCAAIPVDLAESLLFGHLKGAFSGADREQIGYFALADGGTLFLDELGAMPPLLQPKLLRVLEDGLIRPLGARQDRRVDVRVLAATNAPAAALREDLYFRVARFTVALPPLRERREDIALLARHFVRMFAAEMGIDAPALTPGAVASLERYRFPGNVRELKNIVERALIESGGGEIEAAHLRLADAPEPEAPPAALPELPGSLAEAELNLIRLALKHAGGNVSKAAKLLGVDRNRIYRTLAREPAPGDARPD